MEDCGIALNVTLFKGSGGQENEDQFMRIIIEAKDWIHTIKTVPVLDFEFCSLDILWRHLAQPEDFHGIILTSPRCVESLKKCISIADGFLLWETRLKEYWLNKMVFCVGPSTASKFGLTFALDDNCRRKIIVSTDGNSSSLAQSICEEAAKTRIELPLLYPCGSLRMDTLGSCLTQRNIPFEMVTVYKTVRSPQLENALVELNSTAASVTAKDVYVFFSPSGVGYALPHLANLSSKHIIGIGPTTADVLRKSTLVAGNTIHQCPSPTPDGLLEVLEKIRGI